MPSSSPQDVETGYPSIDECKMYLDSGYGMEKLIDDNLDLIDAVPSPISHSPHIEGYAIRSRMVIRIGRALPANCQVDEDKLDQLWHPNNFRMFGARSITPGSGPSQWGMAPTNHVGGTWYPIGYSIYGVTCDAAESSTRPTIIVGISTAYKAPWSGVTTVELEPCWVCQALGEDADCGIAGLKVVVGGDFGVGPMPKINLPREPAKSRFATGKSKPPTQGSKRVLSPPEATMNPVLSSEPVPGNRNKRSSDSATAKDDDEIAKRAKTTCAVPAIAGASYTAALRDVASTPSTDPHLKMMLLKTAELFDCASQSLADMNKVKLSKIKSEHQATVKAMDNRLNIVRRERNELQTKLTSAEQRLVVLRQEGDERQRDIEEKDALLEQSKARIDELERRIGKHTNGASSGSNTVNISSHAQGLEPTDQSIYRILRGYYERQGRDTDVTASMTVNECLDEIAYELEAACRTQADSGLDENSD